MEKIYFKTKRCVFFEQGQCRRNPCSFAHSTEEVCHLETTKMCFAFVRGTCNNVNCRFAHTVEERFPRFPDGEAWDRDTAGVCYFWGSIGHCKYGQMCKFSHDASKKLSLQGTADLRNKSKNARSRGQRKRGKGCQKVKASKQADDADSQTSTAATTSPPLSDSGNDVKDSQDLGPVTFFEPDGEPDGEPEEEYIETSGFHYVAPPPQQLCVFQNFPRFA